MPIQQLFNKHQWMCLVLSAFALTGAPARAELRPGDAFKDCADCPEMVVVPAGNFTMGSSAPEQALANAGGLDKTATDREGPLRSVSIKGFAAGRYAVTKGEFAKLRGGAWVYAPACAGSGFLPCGPVLFSGKLGLPLQLQPFMMVDLPRWLGSPAG